MEELHVGQKTNQGNSKRADKVMNQSFQGFNTEISSFLLQSTFQKYQTPHMLMGVVKTTFFPPGWSKHLCLFQESHEETCHSHWFVHSSRRMEFWTLCPRETHGMSLDEKRPAASLTPAPSLSLASLPYDFQVPSWFPCLLSPIFPSLPVLDLLVIEEPGLPKIGNRRILGL